MRVTARTSLSMIHVLLLIPLLLLPPFLFIHIFFLRLNNTSRRYDVLSSLKIPKDRWQTVKIVGFFHPYCNAGGGGERVLWTAIKLLQAREPNVVSVVYSGDAGVTKDDIIHKVKARFDIELEPGTLAFIFLTRRAWVEDHTWKRFTLLGQSIGSIWLGLEAASALLPDLYLDTMGYAFTFPLFALLGIRVGAYVHYPTISTEMISRVSHRRVGHSNASNISSSRILSQGKLLYYRVFMALYSFSLRRASFLMVNSSWTQGHISWIVNGPDLKGHSGSTSHPSTSSLPSTTSSAPSSSSPSPVSNPKKTPIHIVYPSCDTTAMKDFPLQGRQRVILSVAQFRPEKDHAMQLRSFHKLLEKYPQYRHTSGKEPAVKLVLIGGCRNEGDRTRVKGLRALARELGIEDQTTFLLNASYEEMLGWLRRASIGLSTMIDEHFGINVVEFMAAGVIPIAHASGGPLLDIIVPSDDGKPTGYHAKTAEEFADRMHEVLDGMGRPPPHGGMVQGGSEDQGGATVQGGSEDQGISEDEGRSEDIEMRKRGRKLAVEKFGEEEFFRKWSEVCVV